MFSKKDLINVLENKYQKNSDFYKSLHQYMYQDLNKYIGKDHLLEKENTDIFSGITKKNKIEKK